MGGLNMKPIRFAAFAAFVLLSITARCAAARAEMTIAVPQVNLPKDETPHANQPIEWWYYSGHLADDAGRTYGVMASFFITRFGNLPPAHFVIYQLVEKDGKKFHSGSTIEKDMIKLMETVVAGLPDDQKKKLPPDLLDRDEIAKYHKFMENPKVKSDSLGLKYGDQLFVKTAGEGRDWTTWRYQTKIAGDDFSYELDMKPARGPMFVGGTGNVGLSEGKDMFYYSFTRLDATGTVSVGGEERKVHGTLWYDHQFGAFATYTRPVGWDWFCVQLEDGEDMNLSALRFPDTDERLNRLGTIQRADGSVSVIRDLSIETLGTWTSASTGITYPSGWILTIPSLGVYLTLKPVIPDQEMRTFGPMRTIWEGACTVEGVVAGKQLKGDGYTELVGYGFPKDKQ
jgi:predicted secreted hydrolase